MARLVNDKPGWVGHELAASHSGGGPGPGGGEAGEGKDGGPQLDIRIEVWDSAEEQVERVVAITSSRSIGYAAYHAAKDENPSRKVVMRDTFGVISSWPARKI